MTRALRTVLVPVLLFAATAIPVAANEGGTEPLAPDVGGEVVPGEVVVKWREPAAAAEVAQEHGLRLTEGTAETDALLPSVVSTEGQAVPEVLGELRADPAVAHAEPNYVLHLATDEGATAVAVNDPKTGPQYSLDRMRVRDAWSLSTGGGLTIAVLDTGVDASHPDLAGRVADGWDFVNNDSNANDDNGHGTWVAGIIGANANNGIGIAGVSWSDYVMPVKIMGANGTGDTSDLTSGIVWAADHDASVINMSVGGFPYSTFVHDAIRYAWSKGVVLVGAAGNNGRETPFYPASYPEVVSVSATQVDDEFSNWSNFGADVDVSAPGASVLTTNCPVCKPIEQDLSGDHGYTYISGTSFAAPNVAGVVALIRARFPNDTPSQVVARLIGSVDDLGFAGKDIRYGHGRVNALRALGGSAAQPAGPVVDGLEPNNSIGQASVIPLGSSTRPTIYPAGDADWVAVDVPRAGRLEVRVLGVVDTRAFPWHRSGLPIDPIVELYTAAGDLLARVDNVWESGTELATADVGGPSRLLVRISNFYPNGSRSAYTVTPTYVDNVRPTAIVTQPANGATGVTRFADVRAFFSEAVSNVNSSTLLLRDTVTNAVVPATVAYDPSNSTAHLSPSVRLEAERFYRVETTTGITDAANNGATPISHGFTTGLIGFADTAGNQFAADIDWLALEGITTGCTDVWFCPKAPVTRAQMASFLVRALDLDPTTTDYFADDETSVHEGSINALREAGITTGCTEVLFCPQDSVTRAQMASFLVRALRLEPTSTPDFFADDAGNTHEYAINTLAASGITTGCGPGSYCPLSPVRREQMAAFLHRAFGD